MLSNNLYKIRKRLGVSRKLFANGIGISPTTLANIENGYSESLSTRTICCIMDFLECNYDIAIGIQKMPDRDDDYYNKLMGKLKLIGGDEHE